MSATGLWYLYGGPAPEGELAGFLEIGRSREQAAARLQELVAESKAGPEKERRLTV